MCNLGGSLVASIGACKPIAMPAILTDRVKVCLILCQSVKFKIWNETVLVQFEEKDRNAGCPFLLPSQHIRFFRLLKTSAETKVPIVLMITLHIPIMNIILDSVDY